MNPCFSFGGFDSPVHLILLALSIFWLWMLIDALIHEPTTNDKLLWFLVIFVLYFIGALIYLFVRRLRRA